MDKPEAETLAAELNHEYPEYEHMVLNTTTGETMALPGLEERDLAAVTPRRSEIELPLQDLHEPVTFGNTSVSVSESEVTAYDNHPDPAAMTDKEAA